MKDTERQEYLFVVNSAAGRDDGKQGLALITKFLAGKNILNGILELPERIDCDKLGKKIKALNPHKLIAFGGDGTVTMLATIVANTDISLGIIPGGSANGMAKELGIPEDVDAALDIVLKGAERKIDLIKINDEKYSLHLSDLGLNAHLIKHFDEGKLRGKLGYGLVIVKTLWKKEKLFTEIVTDKETIRRTAFMVVLANATKYGTGAVINPEGKLDDGLFEVIVVRKLSFAALLKMLFKPGRFNPKHIEIFSCRSVNIESRRAIHFQVDGEYIGRVKNLKAEIVRGALKMIVPEGVEG